jgi:hypothetical protein
MPISFSRSTKYKAGRRNSPADKREGNEQVIVLIILCKYKQYFDEKQAEIKQWLK